ncbi:MAG: CvfD/Ygs/GSP13 family RNA-binding post-transcriptional regulator [Turicibacter sp.]|nr:CvfD/Ygs/GSP13 family RNA-binding post-transcriptional regulator [Turicibacter sp.]MDO5793229.1 CvfD/Ygs/GSP13 family RNA-binding post-transcriptional regulator [Turicibacter sp.]
MKIKEGSIVRGKVTGIQSYGAFVQLSEDCNGLIHISELSDGYVKDIRDFVNIGQYIDVKVLNFNSERRQARLSLKGIGNNNYRYHRMKASDFETSSGFAPLAQHLPIWIRDSLEKIARVNKED